MLKKVTKYDLKKNDPSNIFDIFIFEYLRSLWDPKRIWRKKSWSAIHVSAMLWSIIHIEYCQVYRCTVCNTMSDNVFIWLLTRLFFSPTFSSQRSSSTGNSTDRGKPEQHLHQHLLGPPSIRPPERHHPGVQGLLWPTPHEFSFNWLKAQWIQLFFFLLFFLFPLSALDLVSRKWNTLPCKQDSGRSHTFCGGGWAAGGSIVPSWSGCQHKCGGWSQKWTSVYHHW